MGGIRGFADTLVLYILDPVESVSGLLEWTMFYLAYFPEVQSQLQQVTDKVSHTDVFQILFKPDNNYILKDKYFQYGNLHRN